MQHGVRGGMLGAKASIGGKVKNKSYVNSTVNQ